MSRLRDVTASMDSPNRFYVGTPDPSTPKGSTSASSPAVKKAVIAVSPAVEKLLKVKEGLSVLHGDIKDELEIKREQAENKMYEIKDVVYRLEKSLTLEMKKRSEADKLLQSVFETQLNTLQENTEKKMNERLGQLQINLEILQKKLGIFEKENNDEREKVFRAIHELKMGSNANKDEYKTALEAERVSRIEKEAFLLKKFSDETLRLNERIEHEKSSREHSIMKLRDDIDRIEREREKSHERFRARVTEDIEVLRQALRTETENRESAEEQMALTLDQIVMQIQESIRMVSK